MTPSRIPSPLPSGCTWSGWAIPDLQHCEEHLCGWIVDPANTWSNLSYILMGLWLWSRARRDPAGPLRWFGPAAVVVGVTSFAFHASFTFFFQFFDYVGMFVFIMLPAALNLRRLGWLSAARLTLFYWGGILGSCALLLAFRAAGVNIQPIFVVEVMLVVASEAWLAKTRPGTRYADLGWTLLYFGVAVAFWIGDFTRTVCDPSNHWFQGHAMWHLFGALPFRYAQRFYRQFPELGPAETGSSSLPPPGP